MPLAFGSGTAVVRSNPDTFNHSWWADAFCHDANIFLVVAALLQCNANSIMIPEVNIG